MADPATSPASLVVAASSFDASFFSDLVCATITTAGAVTIAPGVVTNTYLTGTPIIDLLDLRNGRILIVWVGDGRASQDFVVFDPTVARSSDPQKPDAVAGTTITLLGIAHLTGGKQGNDTLRGVDGADSLFGGGDRDLIVAGTGVALIDGGSGNDTVPLRDITCGVDDIGLLAGAFADINAATIAGRLTVNATGTVGASSVAHIAFDMSGAGFSRLFFDANGNGAGAAVLIASLTPTTGTLVALGSADFAFL